MSVEYLGTMNNLITIPELGELIGNTNANQGDITWLKFKVDNKILLVSKSICGVNGSWDKYNSLGAVTGKKINIKGIDYKCRFLTGGNGDPSIDDNSEWKKLMVDFYPQTNIIVNSTYTMCQETYYNSDAYYVIRGADSIDKVGNTAKTTSSNNYGWRPVLEAIDSFNITGISENFGEITSFNQVKYTVSNLNGGNFNLTEKVDGQVIRTLNNQVSGTEFTFNIENFDSLAYGDHTIEIIVDDQNYEGNITVTSKFNKIKSPVQPIPTNSNLKQVMLHNKELEKEISYQNFRLSEKLKDNGVEVADVESLSSLISKTSNIGLNFTKQSGVVSAGGNQTINIDISPVDLSKSICWCQLKYNPSNQTAARYFISKFKTSSSLEISRLAYNLTFDVYWEVLEFKSGIRGIYNKLIKSNELSGGYDLLLNYKTLSHDFGILNHDKCVVFLSFSCNNSNNTAFVDIRNITSDAFDVILGGGNYSAFPEINVYIVELL